MASRIVRRPVELVVGRRDHLAIADDAQGVGALVHLAQGLHVDEVAVVAEQVAGAVGDRSDDRDPPLARGRAAGSRRS